MTNNKQQTAVDVAELAMKLYPFSNSERNAFITGYNKAKEMEKERMLKFGIQCQLDFIKSDGIRTVDDIYKQTYGGGEQ
jgi:hypothetical protein